jgi:hypothetical protein
VTLPNQFSTQVRKIDKFIFHNEFTVDLNDIMVIKVDEAFYLNRYVDAIRMADEGYDPAST